jgi:hypothetical protein
MPAFLTHCDLVFLDRFYRERPSGDPLDHVDDDRLWWYAHDYLRRETDVVIDGGGLGVAELLVRFPFLRYLKDRPYGTTFRIADGPPRELLATPWQMHMLGSDEQAPRGIWTVTPEGWKDVWSRLGRHRLFDVCDEAGGRPRLRSWSDLRQYASPVSAIVVCDRYMLYDLDKARENVFELLASLVPETADEPVDITLVTRDMKERSLNRVWTDLRNHLRRRGRAINLTVVRATHMTDYHDRHLFLDHGLLISGHTFNYFRNGVHMVTTTLSYEPALLRSNLEMIQTRLRDVASIVEETPERIGQLLHVVGNRRNRLLEAATWSAPAGAEAVDLREAV